MCGFYLNLWHYKGFYYYSRTDRRTRTKFHPNQFDDGSVKLEGWEDLLNIGVKNKQLRVLKYVLWLPCVTMEAVHGTFQLGADKPHILILKVDFAHVILCAENLQHG